MRELDSVFKTRLPVTALHFANDSVSDSQRLRDPPLKCRLFLDSVCNSILGQFDWVGIFDILQVYPVCRSVFPLTKSTFRCVLWHSASTLRRHISIVGSQGSLVTLVVDYLIQYRLSTASIIALCKYIFGNYVRVVSHH